MVRTRATCGRISSGPGRELCAHTLRPCPAVAGIDTNRWLSALWDWLSKEEMIVSGNEGKTGKSFDDAIDSMLSLIAAVSFVDAHAHIHQGDDPLDGHIIGPSLSRLPDPPDRPEAAQNMSAYIDDGQRRGEDRFAPPFGSALGVILTLTSSTMTVSGVTFA